jgi:GGDEF domain-containing protein
MAQAEGIQGGDLSAPREVLILEPRLDRAELLAAACEEAAPAVERYEHIPRREDVYRWLERRPAVLLAAADDPAGFEAVLRVLRLFPRQVVIAVTAEEDPAWEARLIQEGAADVVTEDEIDGRLLARRLRHAATRAQIRASRDAFPLLDPLTGFLNAAAFFTLGNRQLAKAYARQRRMAAAVVAVRGWRDILLSQGAMAADELLLAAAECLRPHTGRALNARIGPAEFAFLFSGVEPNAIRAAVAAANGRLRQRRGAGAPAAVCEAGIVECAAPATLSACIAAAQTRCGDGIVALAAGT